MTTESTATAESRLPLFPFTGARGIDEEPQLREIRETAPVHRVRLRAGGEAWLVTRYCDVQAVQAVQAVEADSRFSRVAALRPGTPLVSPGSAMPGALISMDPPDHTRVRRLLLRPFSARSIGHWRPRIQEIVDDLLDEATRNGAPIDLYRDFAFPYPFIVICAVLGVAQADQAMVVRTLRLLEGEASAPSQERSREVAQAMEELASYLCDLIARKREHPGDDLLTLMLYASEDGVPLSHDELVGTAQLLFLAGQEATANMLTNSVVALLRKPDQWRLLCEQPALIPGAVEELLRYIPAIVASPTRVATQDVEVGGVLIREGEAVVTVERSANKDSLVFSEPGRLDITRSGQYAHLAFGHGIHHCLGASLARLELQVGLAALTQRLPTLCLAHSTSDLRWLRDTQMYCLEKLPVTW